MGTNPEDHLDGCELDFKDHAISDAEAEKLVDHDELEDEDDDQEGAL